MSPPSWVLEASSFCTSRTFRAHTTHAARFVRHGVVTVVDGVSGALPLEDASCDAGVACLVLCTVPDQERALAELARVIRPGGELRFYEHVVSKRPFEARMQRLADATFWPRIAGGCHLSRDTAPVIERAGFHIESCDRFPFSPAKLIPPDPHILGIARRV